MLLVVPAAVALTVQGISSSFVLLFVVLSGVLLPPLVMIWLQRCSVAQPRRAVTHLLAVVTVAAFAVGLAWSLVDYVPSNSAPETHHTVLGKTLTVSLNDGTSLEMAPLSELHVQYNGRFRNVFLDRGEAYFDVAHDASRPFQVKAGSLLVRAVGTSFSVKRRPGGDLEVLVSQGRVLVLDGAGVLHFLWQREIAELKAGEIFRISPDATPVLRAIPAEQIERKLAWRTGMLRFRGEPLSQVVEELNRFSPTRIVIDDPSIGSVTVGGRLHTDDLPDALSGFFALGVEQRVVVRNGVREIHLTGGEQAKRSRLELQPQ